MGPLAWNSFRVRRDPGTLAKVPRRTTFPVSQLFGHATKRVSEAAFLQNVINLDSDDTLYAMQNSALLGMDVAISC